MYRLVSPWEDQHLAVWEFVSESMEEALVTKVSIGNVWDRYRLVRMKGLDPNKKYHCPQLNITCSGALLMNAGIDMTELAAWDYQSAKFYFHTVDE